MEKKIDYWLIGGGENGLRERGVIAKAYGVSF